MLDDATEFENDEIFQLSQQAIRPLYQNQSTIMTLSFEMSLDQTAIIREIYTFLDMLSDVGGV